MAGASVGSAAGASTAGVASTGLVSSTGAAAGAATGSDIMEDLVDRELRRRKQMWSDDASEQGVMRRDDALASLWSRTREHTSCESN